MIQRLRLCSAHSADDLLDSVTSINSDMFSDVSLCIIDNVCSPMMKMISSDEVRSSVSSGARISHLLHSVAARGAAVLITNNMRGAGDHHNPAPALGSVWSNTAHVRLMLGTVIK